ncbi:MAG: T9SS type A sorting domain-containing protein [Bacteroidia bacterium]
MKILYKIAFLFILLSVSISSSFAQKEGNIWYFGTGAGIDFNTGAAVALNNGQTATGEGVASVCDAIGNLLFYTDGITVWNNNHLLMTNGNGLGGGFSSTQSALIIPMPGNANLYYVFTVGQDIGDFRYSIVDITLSGGLGSVTVKNSLVTTSVVEKLCAVRHSNGTDYWIVVHNDNNNEFDSYLFNSAGLSTTAVQSFSGTAPTGTGYIGYLKGSPDGTKLATALWNPQNIFELYDFDASTGIVSNGFVLPAHSATSGAYGLEFSPNGNFLYCTLITPAEMRQYNVNAGSPALIAASEILIHTSANNFNGALQRAPDEKIYLAEGAEFVGVINNPDAPGLSCNFVDSAITFNSGISCQLGLPNYPSDYFSNTFSFSNLCFGDTTLFTIPNTTNMIAAMWQIDDPAGINDTLYTFNGSHVFSAPGTFNVQLIKYFFSSSIDTINFTVTIQAIPSVNLGNDTSFCDNLVFNLNAGGNFSSYMWQDGSTDSTFTATIAGTYWVTVTNGNCAATDSIVLSTILCNSPIIAFSSSDTSQCEKTCIDFFDLSTNNPTSWQWFFPGADSLTSTQQNPAGICYNNYGSFDVTLIACNIAGCDTLVIQNFISIFQSPPSPTIIQNLDTLICTTIASGYQWYLNNVAIAGATQSTYVATQQGLYYVIITDSNSCNSASNSITINGIDQSAIGNWQLAIKPNPNDGTFQIEFNSNSQIVNLRFQIINLLGEIVFEKDFENMSGKFAHQINLRQPKGIYFLKVMCDEKIFTQKIILR